MTARERPDLLEPGKTPPFHVAGCLVLPALNRIECGQQTHQIEPRVMQVLVCLAARPNAVLSRQTLFDIVWADTVVCEEALTKTISELRRVFGDDTRTPRVIETIRKGGYRLIAPVTPATPAASITPMTPITPITSTSVPLPAPPGPSDEPPLPGPAPSPDAAPQQAPSPEPDLKYGSRQPARSIRGTGRRIWGFVLLAALLSLASWGTKRLARGAYGTLDLTEPRPLTSFPGLELFPALSPDGSMVAFSWAGANPKEGEPLDIYVMKVRNGSPVRLTDLPGSERYPSWSPDGTELVFCHEMPDANEICTIPIIGGSVRQTVPVEAQVFGLSWSPAGRTIALAMGDTLGAPSRIRLLSLESLSRRDLTFPPPHCRGDQGPVFSPDGRRLAFTRLDELGERDAYVLSVEGGEAHKPDLGGKHVSGVDWRSPRELIVSVASSLDSGIWIVPLESRGATRLSVPGGRIQRVCLSRSGRTLVYEKISYARSIRCLDRSEAGTFRDRPKPLIASTQRDSDPAISPDGRSIAFVSDRSGTREIWIADVDGGNPRQLTEHRATQMTRPCWSPDGTQIAYSCSADETSSIYVTQVRSQVARKLLSGGSQVLSVWSRQRNELFYQVDAAGGWELWRVNPDGSGNRRLSEAGYTILDETSDGQDLLCRKSGEPGIWRLPIDGGAASPWVSGAICENWQGMIAANRGLYFLRQETETSTLGFYDPASARTDSLASLDWRAASLALSPDHSMLLYDCIGKIEDDLMVAEVRK